MQTTNPGVQKALGERVKDTPDWLKVRLDCMTKVCTAKFQQNLPLMEFLLETNKTYLAEDNPQDGYWGIKLSRNSPRSKNRQNFKDNHLGEILMQIRENFH
jgi:ribA/ribD-fused uncharacterized protein